MKSKFIIGQAGTAKTTSLMKIASTLYKQKRSFVCIAYTHSAVNNMFEKFVEETFSSTPDQLTLLGLQKHFKTIHAYLGIVPTETGLFFSHQKTKFADVVLIDEFSLIDLETLNFLMERVSGKEVSGREVSGREVSLIFAGDILQLNPVNTNPVVTYELFKNLDIQTDIASAILVGKHLSNNIFSNEIYSTSNKLILKKNYRSGSNVMNILEKALSNEFDKVYHYKDSHVKTFIEEGYVVISSKYINLQKLYRHIELGEKTILSRIGEINVDEELLLTKNINQNFTNGDVVKVELTDNPDVVKIKKGLLEATIRKCDASGDMSGENSTTASFPLLPLNFYSVFKAQGKGFDKVIIVLDDMFEITMLYTAVTRARNEIVFVNIHKLEDVLEDIKIKNKAFRVLKQIVYPETY